MGSMPKSFTWKVGNMRLGAVGPRSPQVGEGRRPASTSPGRGLPAGRPLCWVGRPLVASPLTRLLD